MKTLQSSLLVLVVLLVAGAAQAQTPPEIPLPVIELASDQAGANVASLIACNPGSTVAGVGVSDFCPVDVVVPSDPLVMCIQAFNIVRNVPVPQAQTPGQQTRETCQTVFDDMGNRLARVRLNLPRPAILAGPILYVPQAVRLLMQPLVGTRVGLIPDISFCLFSRSLGGTNLCNDVP